MAVTPDDDAYHVLRRGHSCEAVFGDEADARCSLHLLARYRNLTEASTR